MLLTATGIALVLHFINSRLAPSVEAAPPKLSKTGFEYHFTPPATKISPKTNTAKEEVEADPLAQIRIPRDKAEAWLAKHHRDAASLLAVFRAQSDTNYLNEAVTNFPNDPRVQLAVLAHDAFPADRQKWLESFKQSSPSNSLANYFLAQNYFKEGKTDEAVQELLAASAKPQFDNFAIQNQLDGEELYQDAGKSTREAAELGLGNLVEELSPQLGTIKQLAVGIGDLMNEKSGAGDLNSSANLAQMGFTVAKRFQSGDGGKLLINQLVGLAIKNTMIAHLDQNTAYDFLDGQTPAQALAANKAEKRGMVSLLTSSQAAQPQMTDAEMASYTQRMKIFGELEAMKWAAQLHSPASP